MGVLAKRKENRGKHRKGDSTERSSWKKGGTLLIISRLRQRRKKRIGAHEETRMLDSHNNTEGEKWVDEKLPNPLHRKGENQCPIGRRSYVKRNQGKNLTEILSLRQEEGQCGRGSKSKKGGSRKRSSANRGDRNGIRGQGECAVAGRD